MGRAQLSLNDVYIILIVTCIDNHLGGEERAACFALFVFLESSDCCVAPSRGATGLSVVCDCVFPDHSHLLFCMERIQFILNIALFIFITTFMVWEGSSSI